MNDKMKPCPLCGEMPTKSFSRDDSYTCSTLGCPLDENYFSIRAWNTRPIEDELNRRIAEMQTLIDELGDALTATYNSLPTHWRDHYHCPFDFHALMLKIKRLKEQA